MCDVELGDVGFLEGCRVRAAGNAVQLESCAKLSIYMRRSTCLPQLAGP